MAVVANRRSVMTLFSGGHDVYSHQVRIVLAEKSVNVDIINISKGNVPEDFLDLNPYNTTPTLVDRELVLYNPRIIMEYLDERFPHPPLMPVYPVLRAKSRLMMHRIEEDWYSLMTKIEGNGNTVEKQAALQSLLESLISVNQVFAEMPYFLSDSFSLVDCCIAPLLWRLPSYGIQLTGQIQAIQKYAERIFARETFQASLTEIEREMVV